MAKYLIDSDIIIDNFKKKSNIIDLLIVNDEKIIISFVSYGEVLQGAINKKNLNEIKNFLKIFSLEYIDSSDINYALNLIEKYSLSDGLLLADALIASTAISKKLVLVTNNLKHFRFIPNLAVKSPKDISDK